MLIIMQGPLTQCSRFRGVAIARLVDVGRMATEERSSAQWGCKADTHVGS